MPRALKPCSTHGCPELTTPGNNRCDACVRTRQRASDKRRPSAYERGYTSRGHRKFRRLVLDKDPLCVLCGKVATVADHHPTSRRDLIAAGQDPNNPDKGRGLCASCHGKETYKNQPGGYYAATQEQARLRS